MARLTIGVRYDVSSLVCEYNIWSALRGRTQSIGSLLRILMLKNPIEPGSLHFQNLHVGQTSMAGHRLTAGQNTLR
jgi:hypothetical protein